MFSRAGLPPPDGMGVPGMVSAAAGGPAVDVCGSWATSVSFPDLVGSSASLARSAPPAGGDGEGGSCLRYLAGAGVPVTIVDITATGAAAPDSGIWHRGLRRRVARQHR